jgi:ABC-type multidrug transport system fused ATPase/permease subunit
MKQVTLFKKRNDIKKELMPFKVERGQINYLRSFFFKNKIYFNSLFWLMTLLILIEILIPILLRSSLDKFNYIFKIDNLIFILLVAMLFLSFYIFISYVVIKKQKTLVIYLINDIRRDLFKNFLRKSPIAVTKKDKSRFIVKITYHLSLLQMGLNNSIISLLQSFFFTFGLLLIGLFLDIRMFLIAVLVIPIFFLIFYVGYIISTKYLSRDQTLYSDILKKMIYGIDNLFLLKENNKCVEILEEVDELVEIDNHFRIHREILLKLGYVIIFSAVTFLSVGIVILSFIIPELMLINVQSSIVFAVFTLFLLRMAYTSLRVGLFYFPLKLGIILCVPEQKTFLYNSFKFNDINNIIFKSKKTKFYKEGKYYKNICLDFCVGKRSLVKVSNHTVAKILAEIIAGFSTKSQGIKWILKINGKRIKYTNWLDAKKSVFYINPYVEFEQTLYKILNEHHNLNDFKKYIFFDFLFEIDKFTGHTINKSMLSLEQIALLQILICLVKKPELVVVDATWLVFESSKIKEALNILAEKNKEKILIEIGVGEINYNKDKYDKIYEVK